MKKTLYKNAENVSEIMKILSHPERLIILCYIDKDRKSVSSIVDKTEISQSKVSQYLKYMKEEGILKSKKDGRKVEYEIANENILELMKTLKHLFC